MPLYEYECESCAHRFERIQKYSDPLVDICPECADPVRKLLSSPAFQFKGTGWYVTDYARKDQTRDAEAKAKTKKGEGSGDAGSSGDGGGDASKKGKTAESSGDSSSSSSSAESTKTSGSGDSSKTTKESSS